MDAVRLNVNIKQEQNQLPQFNRTANNAKHNDANSIGTSCVQFVSLKLSSFEIENEVVCSPSDSGHFALDRKICVKPF